MALQETIFTGDFASGARGAEIKAWLEENAADYFDSFTPNGSWLDCTYTSQAGDVTVVSLAYNFGTSKAYRIKVTVNGTTVVNSNFGIDNGYHDGSYIGKAARAQSGIAFKLGYGTMFWVRTEEGHTCIYAEFLNGTTSSNTDERFFVADLEAPGSLMTSIDSGSDGRFLIHRYLRADVALGTASVEWPKTSFAPFIFPGSGAVCPDFCLTPQVQLTGDALNGYMIFAADGKEYAANGAFALKE